MARAFCRHARLTAIHKIQKRGLHRKPLFLSRSAELTCASPARLPRSLAARAGQSILRVARYNIDLGTPGTAHMCELARYLRVVVSRKTRTRISEANPARPQRFAPVRSRIPKTSSDADCRLRLMSVFADVAGRRLAPIFRGQVFGHLGTIDQERQNAFACRLASRRFDIGF